MNDDAMNLSANVYFASTRGIADERLLIAQILLRCVIRRSSAGWAFTTLDLLIRRRVLLPYTGRIHLSLNILPSSNSVLLNMKKGRQTLSSEFTFDFSFLWWEARAVIQTLRDHSGQNVQLDHSDAYILNANSTNEPSHLSSISTGWKMIIILLFSSEFTDRVVAELC